MSGSVAHALIGLVDPSGMSLGFLVPLFTDGRSNTLLAQCLDENGTIAGFEPYGAPDATLLPAPIIGRSTGEPAVHAFAFGKGDVELATSFDFSSLARRLDEPALLKRPLLAMELADFLGLTGRRCEFAARAHASMRKGSIETADQWRDLSVLTTELRRELARRPERSAGRLANLVVARVQGRLVEISGAGDRTSAKQLELVRGAATAALATLAPLYPAPPTGWEVRPRRQLEYREDGIYEAALLLASPRALDLGSSSPWPSPPHLEVFSRDGPEFARVVEESHAPLFVAFDSDQPEQMRKVSGDWTVREMHGIGIDAPRRLPPEADRQHWRVTHVPRAGIAQGGGSQAQRGIVAGIQLAIAAELDRRAADISWRPRNTMLLRARGLWPDPDSDAWAALYDQAWTLGAAPWNSLLIPGPSRMPALSGHDVDWVVNELFEKPSFLTRDPVRKVVERTRATVAMLVDTTPRSEADDARHRVSVTRLLERQGWGIHERHFQDVDHELVLEGKRARVALRFKVAGGVTGRALREDERDIDLRKIERVVVTCAASTGAVLGRLATAGELPVNVRDLVGFDANEATSLSLVGAHLRRIVTGLPSRSRTCLLAMLVRQAAKWGRVEMDSALAIQRAVDSPELGNTLHLAVSSAKVEGSNTSAELRLLATNKDITLGSQWRELARCRLVVAPETVTIHDV